MLDGSWYVAVKLRFTGTGRIWSVPEASLTLELYRANTDIVSDCGGLPGGPGLLAVKVEVVPVLELSVPRLGEDRPQEIEHPVRMLRYSS